MLRNVSLGLRRRAASGGLVRSVLEGNVSKPPPPLVILSDDCLRAFIKRYGRL